MKEAFERARNYLAKLPPAVSGQGGHNATISAACRMVEFGLTEDEVWNLLLEYNRRCQPPWSERELRHKLNDAFKLAAPDPQKTRGGPRQAIPRAPFASTQPAAAAPVKPIEKAAPVDLPEPLADGAAALIRACFRPDEGVRIARGVVREQQDGKTREVPEDGGLVLQAEHWLRRLEDAGGDANAGLFESVDGSGLFISINPMQLGGTEDAHVTAYRHALLEWDDGLTLEEQYATMIASRVPLAAIIYSGSRSIHGWVRVDAKDGQEYRERVAELYRQFAHFRADSKNRNPSRFSRLPECERHGKRQELLAVGKIGAESWTTWLKERALDELGEADRFSALLDLDTTQDPNCVIGFREGKTTRYLCKGKAGWLLGPSGIGKSSLEAEFAVGWALGLPVFGITPVRPLRSLIVQAENDRYDLAEMVQGIAAAHDLDEFARDEAFQRVDENVLFRTETKRVGAAFCAWLQGVIDKDRPDIVWIDPLLSFAGIDVSKQDQVTQFLRGQLNPVLEATGVVMIGIHHTGKPRAAKDTANWTLTDWAYSGLGSSELVNWARAVMLLRPVEGPTPTFELLFAKRGSRAGATHPNGDPAWHSVWLQHARGRIRWAQIDPPTEAPAEGRGKGGSKKPGKPSDAERVCAMPELSDFLRATPSEGESLRAAARRLESWLAARRDDLSESTCIRIVRDLVAQGKLTKTPERTYVQGPNA